MPRSATLPPSLRSGLASVAGRARLLRAVRGLGVLVVFLALGAGAAMAADYFLETPPFVRQALFCTWAGLGFGLFCDRLLWPLFRRVDNVALAAAVERAYPVLGERLTSTVELAGKDDVRYGAPELVAVLVAETEREAAPLRFAPAVPARAAAVTGAAAAAALALALAPAALWPAEYGDLARRFLFPWQRVVPYDCTVTPGDAAVASGSSVTVEVTVRPRNPRVRLPVSAALVLTDDAGAETTQRMRVDRPDAFSLPLTVTADTRYRVEFRTEPGGPPSATASYRLTAVRPVELAPDSPTITITPPAYARATRDEDVLKGLTDLTALQGSLVRFNLRFTRPAVAARLEWTGTDVKATPEGTDATSRTAGYPLALADDGRSGDVTLPAASTGGYRFVLEAEHGVRNELEGGTLTVKPDLPPTVVRFTGREELKAVTPYDKVALECDLADDVGVARAELEYRVNEGPVVHEPFPLAGAGKVEAAGQLAFALEGKAKDGDTVRYRLRVEDNFPKELHGPHVTYAPADRWLTLHVARQTGPLREQEIAAQRDALDRRIEAIRQSLLQELRGLYKLKVESRAEPALTREQRDDLKALETQNQDVEKALRELANEPDASPALRPLAEKARDIADREMQQSQAALREAGAARRSPPERDDRLKEADQRLSDALEKLDGLKKLNEQIARQRADQMRFEALAERQQALADRAAALAKREANDPAAKEAAEQLRREQAETADELRRMAEQNPALKKALDEAAAEQAKHAAERARQLADAQRELADAQARAEKERGVERLSDLAERQRALAEKSAKFAEETKQPARTARTQPLRPDEAKQAADALKEGEADEAQRRQERVARDLDRLADALDRALELARDPREAAKQLAKLQDDLRQRVQDEMYRKNPERPLADRLADLAREQDAIRKAAERLSVPPQDNEAAKDRRAAAESASRGAEMLRGQQPRPALGPMEQTRRALEQLANRLPSREQRQEQALREVARIRKDQEEVARQAEQAARDLKQNDPAQREQAGQKQAEAAKRQAELAEALGKVDAPGEEARRARTQEALDRALADLLDRRAEDTGASQEQAKRELQRLEQALAGQKPADEKARELAGRQQDLADEAAKAGTAGERQKQDLQRKQRDLAREASALPAPEAPQRQAEAADATRRAAESADADPSAPETRRAMETAARKLDALAKQMAGRESEAARADRLAKRQAEAAAETEKQLKDDPSGQPSGESRRRQDEIAREASELRGGDKGREARRRAAEAMEEAQSALRPQERALAQRRAADALRDLADKVGGDDRKRADDTSPRDSARRLAAEQRALADETREAQRDAAAREGAASRLALKEASGRIAEKQDDLNRRATRLPADAAQRGLEEARAAMNRARRSLEKPDPEQAAREQTEAADALDRLAKRLPQESPPPQASDEADDPSSSPRGLPSRAQSEQARALAKEQRNLRDAVRKAREASRSADNAPPRDDPLGDLAKRQAEVARRSAELSRDVGRAQGDQSAPARHGEEAARSTQEAADKMQSGALPAARQAGGEAAARLRGLADELSRSPRSEGEEPEKDSSRRARDLANSQEDINRRADALSRNPDVRRARQQARQEELRQQAGELGKDLDKAAEDMGRSPQSGRSAAQAADAARDAQGRMRQAQGESGQGEQGAARRSQQQAAQALDRAAQQAARAAEQCCSGDHPDQQGEQGQGSPQAGRALRQAQGQMEQAQGQLGQGQTQGASQSMEGAARSLRQAAGRTGRSQQSGQPGGPNQQGPPGPVGAPGGGRPDPSLFGPGIPKYAGKTWGELPGELRTKIVQDMRAKYGEDYARMIKLYFEQLADTKRDGK